MKIKGWAGYPEYNVNFTSPKNVSDVIQKLKDKFDLEISLSTARRAMKSVGFSYITPRKNHYRQDKKEVSKFKKKSST